MKITVLGSGGWGTALALQLLKIGNETVLWSHDEKKAEEMTRTRQNSMLKGVNLPEGLEISAEDSCVADRDLVVIACPSVHIRSVCTRIAPYISQRAVVVSVTKGIEYETLLRMSQIVEQITGKTVVALTGPSHAEEVARGIPTGCMCACEDKKLAEYVQDAFMSDTFRVYTSPDIVGAELGGALKNVIALCAGVIEGMGFGDNTGAMLATRGLTEIARLGVAMGANKDTFAGLAGVGDLIVTCTSRHSRNRSAGVLIGGGLTPEAAMAQVGAVVEGYYATRSANALAEKYNVDMPIVKAAYGVLYENKELDRVVSTLLMRQRRPESEDAGWL